MKTLLIRILPAASGDCTRILWTNYSREDAV